MSSLTVIENNLVTLEPVLTDILPANLPVPRFKQLVLSNFERNKVLTECTPQSITNSVISLAVLGLEPDGITGQSYLLPFKNKGTRLAQPVVGYKGYATMADRSGYTLDGVLIRQNDRFIQRPADPLEPIIHEPAGLTEKERGPIIGAYAIAKHQNRPPRVHVMSLEEIHKVRDNSPGYKFGSQSLWKNPDVYPAMVRKTPVRVLGGQMPVRPLQLAATMEMQHDLGRSSYITAGGQVMAENTSIDVPEAEEEPPMTDITPAPEYAINYSKTDKEKVKFFNNATIWEQTLKELADSHPDKIDMIMDINEGNLRFAERHGAANESQAVKEYFKHRKEAA